MRLFRAALLAGAALAVSACSNLHTLRDRNPQGHDFNARLAVEYLALAEANHRTWDFIDADLFAQKGLLASQGKDVEADAPSARHLNERHMAELTAARARLDAVKTGAFKTSHPLQLARAQVMYDCWLEEQEEQWENNVASECQANFETIVATLTAPVQEAQQRQPAKPSKYTIYFETGFTTLQEESKKLVMELAGQIRTMKAYLVRLTGHSDVSGDMAYNEELSRLRAQRVQVEFMKYGVDKENIEVYGAGARLPLKDPNNPEAPNRRVDVEILK